MVAGVRRGRGHHPAKLVFCEVDGARYEQLRAALGPGAVELRAGVPAPPQTSGPLLHIDVEPRAGDVLRARVTLYVPDVSQPVAPMHEVELTPGLWDRLRRRIAGFDETILANGYHDVFHYAGHDFFDEEHPDRSGLLLADGVLGAADLPPAAPQLVFLSACQSGRLRDGRRDAVMPAPALPAGVFRSQGRSLAEAFLRAGVRSFVGTFYAVDDASARGFAAAVHGELAAGRTLGTAMRTARGVLHGRQKADWGNFLLYGDDGLLL